MEECDDVGPTRSAVQNALGASIGSGTSHNGLGQSLGGVSRPAAIADGKQLARREVLCVLQLAARQTDGIRQPQ